MKKNSSIALAIVVILIIIAAIVWQSHRSPAVPASGTPSTPSGDTGSSTPSAPLTQTSKVSSNTSKYHNAELGFAVNYPTSWEADNTNTGVMFIMPIDQSQVSTVNKLEADIVTSVSKCAFPPVTTVQDRSTVSVGNLSFNMISMSNDVQGRAYFNRMYSLQQGSICYLFIFTSIALSPSSKGLTGSNLTQAQNNNKAIVNAADADFIAMVKSFEFVAPTKGEDEAKAAPAK